MPSSKHSTPALPWPELRRRLALFALLWVVLLPTRLHEPLFGDAKGYHFGAVNIIHSGFYSQDGVTPFLEREPGMSLFLAPMYLLFGEENRIAVFAIQALFYVAVSLVFVAMLSTITSERVGILCLTFLLFFPSSLHAIFSFNRELLALSLLLLAATLFLYIRTHPTVPLSIGLGVVIGFLILTYSPYLLFPLVLIPLFLLEKLPTRFLALTFLACLLVLLPWGLRNYSYRGRPCLTGCTRSAVVWYVRGEQTEQLRGLEPLRCLISEYITRDWDGRSLACSYNAVMHQKWPESYKGLDEDLLIGAQGRKKIVANFGNYLWLSLFEVLELHLPYMNGWGFAYNIVATLSTLILYIGCAYSIPLLFQRKYAFFLLTIAYSVGVFVLTDATPRYLLPAIFAYAAFASIGYEELLRRFRVLSKL